MLELNDTQEGVMNILFRVADEEGLLLLDFKDLRAMLTYVGENASELRKQYGNIAPASVGAIQRALDRKSTRLNSSHVAISYADFCLTKKSTESERNGAEQKKL